MTARKTAPRKRPEPEAIEDEKQPSTVHYEDEGDHGQDEQEESLAGILAELGGESNATINLYRQPDKNSKRLEFMFTVQPDDFGSWGDLLSRIRDEYGGGNYRVHIRRDSYLIKNQGFSIAEVRQKPDDKKSDSDMLSYMRESHERQIQMMQMQNQQTMQLFTALAQNNQPQPSQSPTEMMQSLMQTMMVMKEFTGGNKQEDGVERLLQGIKLAKSLSGDGGSDNVLLEAVKAFGPTLAQAGMGGAQPQQPQGPQHFAENPRQNAKENLPGKQAEGDKWHDPVSQNNQPENSAKNADQKLPSQSEIEEMSWKLKMGLSFLVQKAAENADPALYADLVLDNVPEKELGDLLEQENPIELLANFQPKILDYPEWFGKLLDEVKNAFYDDESEDDADGTDEDKELSDDSEHARLDETDSTEEAAPQHVSESVEPDKRDTEQTDDNAA